MSSARDRVMLVHDFAFQRAMAGLTAAEDLIGARRAGRRPSMDQMVEDRSLGAEERRFLVDVGSTLDDAETRGTLEADVEMMLGRIADQRDSLLAMILMAKAHDVLDVD